MWLEHPLTLLLHWGERKYDENLGSVWSDGGGCTTLFSTIQSLTAVLLIQSFKCVLFNWSMSITCCFFQYASCRKIIDWVSDRPSLILWVCTIFRQEVTFCYFKVIQPFIYLCYVVIWFWKSLLLAFKLCPFGQKHFTSWTFLSWF